MQHLNFASQKIFFSAISKILFLRVFLRLLINCLNSKRNKTFPSLLRIFHFKCFYLLHFDLRCRYIQVLKMLLLTLKNSFSLFFHNLLFQNMLISLVEKESPRQVLLNIQRKCGRSKNVELINCKQVNVYVFKSMYVARLFLLTASDHFRASDI